MSRAKRKYSISQLLLVAFDCKYLEINLQISEIVAFIEIIEPVLKKLTLT